ncbi:hypothetical protein BDY24DRAFT_189840 [Mrakia frigida]|uniref:uncharacterized protein n=1 Tax=Mrakia frigida TaxID=29902 RepID=UPI003FCBFA42
MVKLTLLIKATLDNVTELQPKNENHEFHFKIQCSSCHEEHPSTVPINRQEEHDISSSRGSASFVWRCSFCKRESTLSFLPPQAPSSGTLKAKKNAKIPTTTTPLPLNESDDWSVFLTVECRGMEVVGFDFEGEWKAKVPDSDTVFEDIVFEDGRWDEYDEESKLPCSIEDLEAKWVKA